jgi:hypothetical protein
MKSSLNVLYGISIMRVFNLCIYFNYFYAFIVFKNCLESDDRTGSLGGFRSNGLSCNIIYFYNLSIIKSIMTVSVGFYFKYLGSIIKSVFYNSPMV